MIQKRRVLRHALWASAITCGLAMAAGVVMAAGGGLSRPRLIKVSVTDGASSSAVALSATPSAPGARVWTFDHDRGYQLPKDWTAVSGRWQVLTDFHAPSLPNTFGLAGYGLPRTKYVMLWIKSFFTNHYMVALPKDSIEYSDLTLQANFLPWGGAWGSYAGLIFRYENPKNYYVLVAACPKDYLGLYRMSDGNLRLIKKVSAPQLERGHWYSFRVVAQGDHFTGFLNGKQMLEAHDSGIAKGRIGVWSQNDSRINFDNIQVIAAQSAPAA